MKPTDILKSEHRVIEQVLDCLVRMTDECGRQGRLDAEAAEKAVDFFRTFADRCHHGKEEVHLFPALEARGFSRAGGPTGVMLHEHEQGRAHVRAMDDAIEAAAAGDAEAIARFTQHARAYVALLREHIQKEDDCLFAMADQAFDESDQAALTDIFDKVEAEEMGQGTHEAYLKIANDLADRFKVAKAEASRAAHHGCGCGH